jgi:putative transposase
LIVTINDIDRLRMELRPLDHTRESLLNVVERSITAERLIEDLERSFATADGPPMVLRMDNGPEMISQALQQFCDGKVGVSYIPPGKAMEQRVS